MIPTHLFEHKAMNTTFTLRLVTHDAGHARTVAIDCFTLLDELENQLSRYRDGSDVWQINYMKAGETLIIGEATYECMKLALYVSQDTGGLFDITLGKQIELRKAEPEATLPPVRGVLQIDPERPAVHCIEAGREIDLGGIGKGFALDCMLQKIKDWGNIDSAHLAAGASTHLACGERPWKIAISESKIHELREEALSVSGTEIQDSHIINPQSPDGGPPRPQIRVTHPSAAMADAYSTAALCMTEEQLAAFDAPNLRILRNSEA